MITYKDGTAITYGEAARLVEAEGRLIADNLTSPKGRCILGVLGDYHGIDARSRHPLLFLTLPMGMVSANNAFKGTREGRAAHMAAWLRALDTEVV